MPGMFMIINLATKQQKSNKAVNLRIQPTPTQIYTTFHKPRLIYNILTFVLT